MCSSCVFTQTAHDANHDGNQFWPSSAPSSGTQQVSFLSSSWDSSSVSAEDEHDIRVSSCLRGGRSEHVACTCQIGQLERAEHHSLGELVYRKLPFLCSEACTCSGCTQCLRERLEICQEPISSDCMQKLSQIVIGYPEVVHQSAPMQKP